MDSSFINDAETQAALVEAAQSKTIFVVASIDRVPILPLSFFTMMQFCPINVNTNRYYTQEVGLGGAGKTGAALASIDRFTLVLKTLTSTAMGIFKVLLKHQIKTGEGLGRSEWLDKAITEMCTRLQATFKGQITEFLDHRLIAEKKGTDMYTIPLTQVELQSLQSGLEAAEAT
jgi:hypothetical protein